MALPFQGNGSALSNTGLATVAGNLKVQAAEIWTVMAVETSGCGYLPDRRPQILYERHIFHRLTGGKYDDGDISDPTPGGYGKRGAPQYDRLARAIAKDRNAALQSASWGLGQIMGMNYSSAGFKNVEDMVAAMSESEDQQLIAMGNFLTGTKLATPLQAHDWASFARGYNGKDYAINQYDVKLNSYYQKYSSGPSPDLNVRAAQLYLTYLGFTPGPIDGAAGTQTMAALAQFETKNSIPHAAGIDDNSVAQLRNAVSQAFAAAG